MPARDVPLPRGRVPVEHRLWGLDRRTVPLAAAVLAVWLLWAFVVPWIDDHVAWNDPVPAGALLQVDKDVTMTPASGWDLEKGLLTTQRTRARETYDPSGSRLTTGGVTVTVRPGPFRGTPTQLLSRAERITTTLGGGKNVTVTTAPHTIETTQGTVGAVEGYRTLRGDGIVAAFVFGGRGVTVAAFGPPAEMQRLGGEVRDMIVSLRKGPRPA